MMDRQTDGDVHDIPIAIKSMGIIIFSMHLLFACFTTKKCNSLSLIYQI